MPSVKWCKECPTSPDAKRKFFWFHCLRFGAGSKISKDSNNLQLVKICKDDFCQLKKTSKEICRDVPPVKICVRWTCQPGNHPVGILSQRFHFCQRLHRSNSYQVKNRKTSIPWIQDATRDTHFLKEHIPLYLSYSLKSNFLRLEFVKVCLAFFVCPDWIYDAIMYVYFLWAESTPWMPTRCCVNYQPQIKQQGLGTLPCCGYQTTLAFGHST